MYAPLRCPTPRDLRRPLTSAPSGSDYTRLNHSGEANRGPPLQEEIMQQLPEAVRPRFAEYE